ncbi:MAG: sugar-transfer associated ATP-grasp domain-containing protein [Firmicutes bacterium]|nr:sugar-transfer associated ATP-grasp domain-containing protein [Bacillota bacterium]
MKRRVRLIADKILWLYRRLDIYKEVNKTINNYKRNGGEMIRLNSDEIKLIYNTYNSCGFSKHFSKKEINWFCSASGKFSNQYIPSYIFRRYIEPHLNNKEHVKAWADKSYYDLFLSDVNFPKTIVRNVDGVFYDEDYNLISESEANRIVSEMRDCIIKPSIDSGSGNGVSLINVDTDVSLLLKKYKSNFVIQKRIIQHHILSRLNHSSVNVVRIVSLMIDNDIKILSSALRIGTPGSITDNLITDDGKGMVVVGIEDDGTLKCEGCYANGIMTKESGTGYIFKGIHIPEYNEMINVVKKAHTKLGHFKMISWDMCVDEQNNVIVMEYNIKAQGITYYQITNGPLFGEYTDRILKDVFK